MIICVCESTWKNACDSHASSTLTMLAILGHVTRYSEEWHLTPHVCE